MRYFWLGLGCVSLVLGIIGIVLPVLPTTPFLLLTAYSFAKGSDKFNRWFVSTRIYKFYLEDYLREKALTMKQKIRISLTVLVFISFAVFIVPSVVMKVILGLIFLGKVFFLYFYVKTKPASRQISSAKV